MRDLTTCDLPASANQVDSLRDVKTWVAAETTHNETLVYIADNMRSRLYSKTFSISLFSAHVSA